MQPAQLLSVSVLDTDEIEVKSKAEGELPHYELFPRSRKDDCVAYLADLGADPAAIEGYLAEAGW